MELVKSATTLTNLNRMRPNQGDKNSEYEIAQVPCRNEYVLRSSKVDRMLRAGELDPVLIVNHATLDRILDHLRSSADLMELALQVESRAARLGGKQFFNDPKIGLASDLRLGIGELEVFRGSYFITFLTNDLSMLRLETTGAYPGTVFDGWSLYPYLEDEYGNLRLKSIPDSLMCNQIGVDVIGHTLDGYLRFWRQRASARRSEGLVTATGSGSCDWKRLVGGVPLSQALAKNMVWEVCEESTERGAKIDVSRVLKTAIIGFSRRLNIGGLPIFSAVAKLGVRISALAPNIAEVDSPRQLPLIREARDYKEMVSSVNEMCIRKDLSVPLWVTLNCLLEALKEDGAKWRSFFWGS